MYYTVNDLTVGLLLRCIINILPFIASQSRCALLQYTSQNLINYNSHKYLHIILML